MALIVCVIVVLVMEGLAFAFQRVSAAFAAALFSIISGVYCYLQSTAVWDVYYAMFWGFIGLAIVAVLEAMSLRGRTKEEELSDELEQTSLDRYIDKQSKMQEKMDKLDDVMSSPSDRRRRKRRDSRSDITNTRLE